MPKVKNYAAAWLADGSQGHKLFEPSPDALRSRGMSPAYSSKSKKPAQGPTRTIARRGTEVFVAVGREIRWGDLAYLKEDWSSQARSRIPSPGSHMKREDSVPLEELAGGLDNPGGMRTIKTPVADQIRQLVISPNSNLLAILTAHTVHICVLPDSSHLTSQDDGPIKPKIFTLGPTTHVTSRSPVMSALWHPLGVHGTCIVTVTLDAIVRVWEISTADRWSFDAPSTSIDLKKLADGLVLEQDFSASTNATGTAFSPDSFELEVAAASFPSRGSGGWNPMTLWVAMREGDVYALCPLLPQRWAPPPTLIPSLSVSIVTMVASLEDDPQVTDSEKLLAQQQMEWMGDLDAQDPQILDSPLGKPVTEVYARPPRPGVIPRLQGPFDFSAEPETGDELDTSVTDIMVIGKKTETDELMLGEEDDLLAEDGDQEGLSLSVVCLLSTSGQLRIYLDLEGVQAQWLPPKRKSKMGRPAAVAEVKSLLSFQAVDTMSPVEVSEESWPVFSPDLTSRYSFFVTHHAAITFLSLSPWVFRLEAELNGDSEAGTDFRIGLLVNAQSTRDRVYSSPSADNALPLAACVVFRDPDVGYFLLSAAADEPIALTFESPDLDLAPHREESPVREQEAGATAALDFYEPRPVYQPPRAFLEHSSALPALLERLRTSRHKTLVSQEVRLSPLSLQIFTDAHKVLSEETHRLGVAASELFRRCEMLQTELRQQIAKANEVKVRVDSIRGTHRDDDGDNAMYELRLASARERQVKLAERVEQVRRVTGKATTRVLSAKERAFAEEVRSMEAGITGQVRGGEAGAAQPGRPLWKRLQDIKRVQAELVAEAESVKKTGEDTAILTASPDLRIPQDIRRMKLQQVRGLLSRETALVEAVTARLEKLQAGV